MFAIAGSSHSILFHLISAESVCLVAVCCFLLQMKAREGKKLHFSFSRKYRRRMAENNA